VIPVARANFDFPEERLNQKKGEAGEILNQNSITLMREYPDYNGDNSDEGSGMTDDRDMLIILTDEVRRRSRLPISSASLRCSPTHRRLVPKNNLKSSPTP
jgi:hypothetical protein